MGDRHRQLRRPDPGLRSDRVVLRPWTAGDVDALVAAWQDPEIARWTAPPTVEDLAGTARRWIEQNPVLVERGRSLDLVVEVDGAVAGEVGLVQLEGGVAADPRVELGWWVLAGRRGEGLASEAVRLFADWVLAPDGLGFRRADAVCADANHASGAVARHVGFAPCDRPAPPGHTTWTRSRR